MTNWIVLRKCQLSYDLKLIQFMQQVEVMIINNNKEKISRLKMTEIMMSMSKERGHVRSSGLRKFDHQIDYFP